MVRICCTKSIAMHSSRTTIAENVDIPISVVFYAVQTHVYVFAPAELCRKHARAHAHAHARLAGATIA